MPLIALIITAAVLNAGAFVAYPESGKLGPTFLYLSTLTWTAFAIMLNRAIVNSGVFGRVFIAVFFTLLCAFSTLSFLPQRDGVTALQKLSDGKYPDNLTLYYGLRRLGIDVPGLLPPEKEEKPVI